MKFKDLPSGEIFTYWNEDKHRTAIKIGEQGTSERERAVCLDTGEIVDVRHNKDVKELDNFDITLEYKVGRDGKGFLCSPLPGGKVLARRILLIGSEIMNEETLKTVSHRKTGGEGDNLHQVYITLEIFERKYKDLETAFRMLKMMLDENMSEGSSDNKIMLTGDDPRRLISQLQ